MTETPRERPKTFQELQSYNAGGGQGLHANSRYIYPVGVQYAGDAWFAPIIALEGEVLWQGEPQEDSVGARLEARKYLTLKLKELLNPLAFGEEVKRAKRPNQLF